MRIHRKKYIVRHPKGSYGLELWVAEMPRQTVRVRRAKGKK